jgi:hypothetical protein
MGGIRTFEVERPVAGTDVHFHVRGIEVSGRLRPASRVGKERRPLSSLSRPVTLTVVPSGLSLLLARIDIDTTIGLVETHLLFEKEHGDPFKDGSWGD